MKQRQNESSRYCDSCESPVGMLYLVFESSSLTEISFDKPKSILFKQSLQSSDVKKQLEEYFDRSRTEFNVKTVFTIGTDFEKLVWQKLREVPYGETRTYKWLAEQVGKPSAFRAVGNALGRNPLPIFFPCHRIIESDGTIGGYSSGVSIKRRLLEIEYYTRLSQG